MTNENKEQEELQLEERKILIDTKNADRTFEKYGHVLSPLAARNRWGRYTSKNTGYRYWEQKDEFKKFLGVHQTFYPNEEVEAQLEHIFKETLNDYALKIAHKYESHGGYSNYWTILSDKFANVNPKKDDIVQVGCTIRNGIGTDVALGADFFTNRVVCSNGLVARSKETGSISIKHVGPFEAMTKTFTNGIKYILERFDDVIWYYRKATDVSLTEDIANNIYQKSGIADKYYPKYFKIEEKKKKNERTGKEITEKFVSLTKEAADVNLWQAVNDITEPLNENLNKNKTIGFYVASQQLNYLHKVLVRNV